MTTRVSRCTAIGDAGQLTIYWPGVFLFAAMIAVVDVVVVCLMNAYFGFGFSLQPFPFTLIILNVFSIVGVIRYGLQRPLPKRF